MRVLVAMSGGVDSSVCAALLASSGHEVCGVTMKLWGGPSDSGCCSVADVEDARRVADTIGIDHRVFNFADEFESGVVAHYVSEHGRGHTPNPCVDCNRQLKFGALVRRAERLGFEALATGHHARIERRGTGVCLRRGVDAAKDQSYVLSTLSAEKLRRVLLPIGELTKAGVRDAARRFGLRTAAKPDSQDVCFIPSREGPSGRRAFLADRMALHPGRVLDAQSGAELGRVEAVELVTVGQRRGLNVSGARRYAVAVDVATSTVLAGVEDELLVDRVAFAERSWFDTPLACGTEVLVQTSAHGEVRPAWVSEDGIRFKRPQRRVAPGQVVACYVGDVVVGAGIAA